MKLAKMEQNKAIELLEEARGLISQASVLIPDIEVSEKVGEEYRVTEEFEKVVEKVFLVSEAIEGITTTKKEKGVLDILEESIKEKLKEFFKSQYKQKKYEGKLMEMGYTVSERKVIDGKPDKRFIKISEAINTQAVNEYKKATKSDDFPDGKLPVGIKANKFEYIRFKQVI